jgi:hypothetical protein
MDNFLRRRIGGINSFLDEEDYNYGLDYNYGINYPIIESPETILARKHPFNTLNLLDNESRRKHYNGSLSIGCSIAQTYLSGLNSESLSKINKIKVEPHVWGGFSRGRGMVISFKR